MKIEVVRGTRGRWLKFLGGAVDKIDRKLGVFWDFQVFLGLLSRFWEEGRVRKKGESTMVVLCPRVVFVGEGL